MMRWTPIGSIVSLMLLAGGPYATAASSGVRDGAHFFSPDAISQADGIIRQIDARHHKDVLIETIPEIPQDQRAQYEQQGKSAFFGQWTDQRAQAAGVNGVYVLICKNPPHLEAAVGSPTRERLFTTADRDRLVSGMLNEFRQKQYDAALIKGVQFVQKRMDQNAGTSTGGTTPYAAPPPGQSTGGTRGWGIGGIACLVIGFLLIILLIRGVLGGIARRSYGPGGYPPQGNYPPGAYPPGGYPGGYGGGYGGGGGFGRGFLGGLLGGALGGYAADKWFGQHQAGGGYVPPQTGGQDLSSGVDTSFSSSGGDFGTSDTGSSGADFGGGDSGGGGDFGGGDVGGGGDFGGGGGGGDFGGGDTGSSGGDF